MQAKSRDKQAESDLRQIGKNLRKLRIDADLPTQESLALEAGIMRSHVSAIERGAINPNAVTVIRIARALGVHPGRLFDGIVEQRLQ